MPLFAQCSKRDLQEIAKIADEVDFPEGKELIREGDRGREFFVIVEGSVTVTKRGRKLKTLGAGDFFGEVALVSDIPRIATVKTASPVRALVVTDRAFRSLLERSGHIQLKVLDALGRRVVETARVATL